MVAVAKKAATKVAAKKVVTPASEEAESFVQKSKLKMPKSLAQCADMLYEKREARLAAQRGVDAMELEERDLREWLILNLPKSQATGVSGKVANVRIESKVIPQVADWDKMYAYIKRTDSFDLLNKAANRKAIEARWDAGKVIPGVDKFNAVVVSCTKVTG